MFSLKTLLSLLCLAPSFVLGAIEVHGQYVGDCKPQKTWLECSDLLEGVCCTFPRGGLQVQAVWWNSIHTCYFAVFYKSTQDRLCGLSRDTTAGPETGYCMTGGSLSPYFGGGAMWLNIEYCSHVERGNASLTTAELDTLSADPAKCTSRQIPTIYAWVGGGAWVLNMDEAQFEEYNKLPVTNDHEVHIENVKAFGGAWYADAMDSPSGKRILEARASAA